MRNIAEFQIIGRVGGIKTVGTTTRISLCANYAVRGDDGNRRDEPYWNEVTVFAEATRAWIVDHIETGDLVHARGRVRQRSYERGGERVFTVDLVCTEFSRLAAAADDETA
jgi:single-stranded DNA-binding protein